MSKKKANQLKLKGEIKRYISSNKSSKIDSITHLISNESKDERKRIKHLLMETLDGCQFLVQINIARMFLTIKSMMEDSIYDDRIPIKLSQVSGRALGKMIQFAELHVNDPPVLEEFASKERRKTSDINEIDRLFVETLNLSQIFELIVAANFLDFQLLLDILCKSVANMIKAKNVDEIRKTFNIVNDFTPIEEEQLRRENGWIEKS